MAEGPFAYDLIAQLAVALDAHPLHKHEACWEFSVDENWYIAVNGHDKPRLCSNGVSVDPYTAYIAWNGWPAGILGPSGGPIAAGRLVNEQALCEALQAAIRRSR